MMHPSMGMGSMMLGEGGPGMGMMMGPPNDMMMGQPSMGMMQHGMGMMGSGPQGGGTWP